MENQVGRGERRRSVALPVSLRVLLPLTVALLLALALTIVQLRSEGDAVVREATAEHAEDLVGVVALAIADRPAVEAEHVRSSVESRDDTVHTVEVVPIAGLGTLAERRHWTDGRLVVERDVAAADGGFRTVRLTMEPSRSADRMGQLGSPTADAAIFAFAIIAIAVLVILERVVIGPLSVLTQAVRSRTSDSPRPIESRRRDEIGGLSRTLADTFAQLDKRETALRQVQELLSHQAMHDSLTGLANRRLVIERLGDAIDTAERTGAGVSVLFIDLDRFKVVNDALGHASGDNLLRLVALRLERCAKRCAVVGRLAGDEFVVVLIDDKPAEAGLALGDAIIESISSPFTIAGPMVFVSASVGVAVAGPGDDPSDLLRNADVAMYRAKAAGPGHCLLFDGRMQEMVDRRHALENALRAAIANREFIVEYQPVINVSGLINGFEALVRWDRPGHGVLPPAAFIDVAVDSGLISDIGLQVLERACADLAAWRERGLSVRVAVNVSGHQLGEPSFAEQVRSAVRRHGLPPEAVILEVTESELVKDLSRAVDVLAELRAEGIKVAIDDFGTGYSSLNYLRSLPCDIVKIDQSFVRGVDRDSTDAAIVSSVVSLARALDLEVVAEGVERLEQYDAVRQLGCDKVQGMFIAPPLPMRDAESFALVHG
ncbi:MAG: putative bifunctional diguanylate cyclase/phosphodiesterase [Acidimicrobiia bacterium]